MSSKNEKTQAPDNGLAGKLSSLSNNHYIHIGVLALITIALYSQFIFSDKMLYSTDQIGGLDSKVFFRNSVIEDHQFPTWFSCRLGGMPSIDASFGDAFYPPSILIHIIFPIHRALGIKLILHVLLAGIFFYILLLKGFGAPPLIACIGAVLYMLNPQFISHTYPGHDGKMFIIAWLPFVVWRLKMLMEKPGLLNSTLLALGIAACLLTSHVQLTYFMLWGLFLYWVIFLFLQWKEEKNITGLIPAGGFFWLAVFLGLAMAFLQLYPTFMFVRGAYSVRGVDRGFDFAASWSLHWEEFISLWIPEFVNWLEYYWGSNPFKLNSDYAGAMITLFGIISVVSRPKPWRIFWGAIVVLAVLYSLGAHSPVFHLAYHLVPGVKKFRAASMMMFWASFGFALLTGLFFIDVFRGKFASMEESARKKWQKGLFIALAAITALTLLFSMKGFTSSVASALSESLGDPEKAQAFEMNFDKNFVPMLWLWWFFAAAALLMLWALIAGKVNKTVFAVVIAIIGITDAARVDSNFIKAVSARPYFYTEQELADLADRMDKAPFRCFSLPGALTQNGEGIHGLEGITGFHDNELRWYRKFRGDRANAHFFQGLIDRRPDGKTYLVPSNLKKGNNFLNIANARYILTRQKGRILTIQNSGALGRLSFVPGYKLFDETEILRALREGTYDIRHAVGLMEKPQKTPAPFVETDSTGPLYPSYSVAWEKYSVNYRRAVVNAPRDGFLRISEVYYPGWEIFIDGTQSKIYRADYAWMAVYFPEGTHTVEMRPRSQYLRTAAMISFPVIIGMIIYWIIAAFIAKPQSQNKQDKIKKAS
ncbi:MAG: hypothetical protein GF350_14080 [Chitinivibrionales bacterium]|nr:hypothetical protein [Chitinivibrionales bacterium]